MAIDCACRSASCIFSVRRFGSMIHLATPYRAPPAARNRYHTPRFGWTQPTPRPGACQHRAPRATDWSILGPHHGGELEMTSDPPGDMPAEEFREEGRRLVQWLA